MELTESLRANSKKMPAVSFSEKKLIGSQERTNKQNIIAYVLYGRNPSCPRASRTPWSRSSCSIALQTIETDRCPNLSRSSVRLIEIGSMTIFFFVQRRKRDVLHQVYLLLRLRVDKRETRGWSFPKPSTGY